MHIDRSRLDAVEDVPHAIHAELVDEGGSEVASTISSASALRMSSLMIRVPCSVSVRRQLGPAGRLRCDSAARRAPERGHETDLLALRHRIRGRCGSDHVCQGCPEMAEAAPGRLGSKRLG